MKTITLKTLLILTIALYSNTAIAQFYSSSFPPDTNETLMELPDHLGLTGMQIRVKVFPHTLRNDWRHGPADDSSRFQLIAEEANGIQVNNQNYSKLIFKAQGNTLVATTNGKSIRYNKFPVIFTLKKPTKILRYGNESKSHTYTGKLYVTATNGRAQIVNHIPLMTYIKGVVPSESSHSWPLESLKAQAVAARSYAVFHKLSAPQTRSYDVDDTARYQVYSGESHRFPSTDLAVEQTENEIMTYNGKVIIAFFHAYSGGETDSGKNIFKQNNVPYCKGSPEIFVNQELRDMVAQRIHWIIEWNKEWSRKDLLTKLKAKNSSFRSFNTGRPYQLSVKSRQELFGGSIKELKFTQNGKTVVIDFHKLRSNLGWSNFNSYHFFLDDSINENTLKFRGFGWGHHVGMSQWGAYVMSKKYGSNYRDILTHYYDGIEIRTL